MIRSTGECCISIVKSVVDELIKEGIDRSKTFLVIRSTVIPGTSDNLGCYFMPEFLTEKNFINDFKNCDQWIFGLRGIDENNDNIFKNKINMLFSLAKKYECINYNNTNFVQNKEAEIIKYFRNCFLALKVSFCNEIYEYCNALEINYNNVQKIATSDKRIGPSHSKVPGHDGSRGYGGTCFPKDVKALLFSMKENDIKCPIIESMDFRNCTIDRPENDWEKNEGRSII